MYNLSRKPVELLAEPRVLLRKSWREYASEQRRHLWLAMLSFRANPPHTTRALFNHSNPARLRPSLARLSSSSAPAPLLKPTHTIYVSESTNPYFNLSLEDWLFRNKPHSEPLLLLYRDTPCVVIGRNQNPWKEVNLPSVRAAGVPFIRRRSGGGTVYHVRIALKLHIAGEPS